ncbi:MAG: hypothetical protein NVSMB1_11660 [Polyangiales bacterium]
MNPTIPGKHKNVQVTVIERSPFHIELRAGYSTGEGVRGYAEFGYDNLGGYAVDFVGKAKMSYQPFILPPEFYDPEVQDRWRVLKTSDRLPRRLSLGLTFPQSPLFGSTVRTSIEFLNVLDLRRDFKLDRNSPVVTFTYQPVRTFTAVFAADLEFNNFKLLVNQNFATYLSQNQGVAPLLRIPAGETRVGATRATFTLDFRDNPLNATRNGYFSITNEYVRTIARFIDPTTGKLGTRQDFLHLTSGAGLYFKIPWLPKKPVLAFELKGGDNVNVFSCYGKNPDECDTYPDRLFYLGGSDSFRGMYPGEMLPQDSIDQINDQIGQLNRQPGTGTPNGTSLTPDDLRTQAPRGGNVYINPRLELRVQAFRFGGLVGFLDAANSWREKSNFKPWILRYALGIGLFFDTPFAPVGIDLGCNLTQHPEFGERPCAVNISISRF